MQDEMVGIRRDPHFFSSATLRPRLATVLFARPAELHQPQLQAELVGLWRPWSFSRCRRVYSTSRLRFSGSREPLFLPPQFEVKPAVLVPLCHWFRVCADGRWLDYWRTRISNLHPYPKSIQSATWPSLYLKKFPPETCRVVRVCTNVRHNGRTLASSCQPPETLEFQAVLVWRVLQSSSLLKVKSRIPVESFSPEVRVSSVEICFRYDNMLPHGKHVSIAPRFHVKYVLVASESQVWRRSQHIA